MIKSVIKKIDIVLQALVFILIFGVVAVFVVTCANSEKNQYINGGYEYLSDGWSLVLENGDLLPLDGTTAPEEYTHKDCSFVHEIGEMPADSKLFILSRTRLKVYVDDELRYEVDSYDSPLPTRTVKDTYHSIQLYRQDAGKQLTIICCDDHYPNNKIREVVVGDSLSVYKMLFNQNGLSFILSVLLLVMAVVIIIFNIILNIRYKNRIQAYALGLGIFLVALWEITAGLDFQLVFGITVIDGITGFLATMLLPLPFMYHMNKIQNYRYDVLYFIVRVILLLNFGVFTYLNFFGNSTFKDNLLYIDLVVGIALVALISTIGIDWVKKRVDNYRDIAIGYMGLIIFSMMEIVVINVPLPFDMLDGICIILGLYFLQAMTVLSILREMSNAYLKGAEAIRASQQKSNFLANMSHEIRTPINTVLGLDTMIIRESKEANIKKYARDIQTSGRTLLSLINDILDFSKIESGKMELVYSEYKSASIVSDIAAMIGPKAAEKNLDFIIDIDENIPSILYGDDVRIKQVVTNLLTNAVKYTHEGSVTFKARLVKKDEQAVIAVSVKDTGIGIKPEDIEKLSEKFVRIEESRNKNIEGTGLGMNIVINLLQLMDSKIEVDSIYGEGSDFHFTISQKIVDDTPIGNIDDILSEIEDDRNYEVSFCIPDCKLLVVDDNAMNRNVFISLLKDMQCQIDGAESGYQCLEMIQKTKYDIIFMDHMMPEMDGIETFNRMREMDNHENSETPVIILTANAIVGAREEYISAGFNGYLSKPINPDELEALIGSLIPDDKKSKSKKIADEASVGAAQPADNTDVDFPFVDGVDWQAAMMRLNDEDLLRMIVEGVVMTADSDMGELKAMYEDVLSTNSEDAFKSYRIKVHSLKSNVANFGAYHVAGLAKYLEYAARDNDIDVMKNIMPLFEREWNSLMETLSEEFGLNSESDENLPIINKDDLLVYLNILSKAMDDFDDERADAVVEELSAYSYSGADKEFFEQIKLHVMNLDGDACNQTIEEWKGTL